MSTSITIGRKRGDDEVHISGCQHLQRREVTTGDGSWGTFTGPTIVDAIRAADADMAAAFGQEAYKPNPDDVPWTVSVMHHAPCFVKALPAGLRFRTSNGEPYDRAETEARVAAEVYASEVPEAGFLAVKDEALAQQEAEVRRLEDDFEAEMAGRYEAQFSDPGEDPGDSDQFAGRDPEDPGEDTAPDPFPAFNQSGKRVRLGSEVLISYPEGDADVGMVTGIEAVRVWVQVPGRQPVAFTADDLAPFEAEDMDPEVLTAEEDEAIRRHDDRAEGIAAGRWAQEHITEIVAQRGGQPDVRDAARSPEWVAGYIEGVKRQAAEQPRWTAQFIDDEPAGYIGIFSPSGALVDRVQTTWGADAALHNRSRLHEVAVRGTSWACKQCSPGVYDALWQS